MRYKAKMERTTHLKILELRPNNWFLSQTKLKQIRDIWRSGDQDRLNPILVSKIDGEWALIDGHSRTYVAYQHGQKTIKATIKDLRNIPGENNLYEYLHRRAKEKGLNTIADLSRRILKDPQYTKQWLDFCRNLLRDLESP